jgi:purine-binding chemotaxis protein CheW
VKSIGQFVAFRLASSRYGIEIRSLVEVVNMVALTPVPSALEAGTGKGRVAGLLNMRGVILRVFDLRALFGLTPSEPTSSTRILIVKTGERSVGLIVDAVEGVVDPQPGDVSEMKTGSAKGASASGALTHVYQIPDGLVLIVDVDLLLADVEIGTIDQN